MKDKQAVRPDRYFANIPSLVGKEGTEVTEEERFLYSMSSSNGWQVFKKYADEVVADLDEINSIAIAKGENFEEIGKNTIVINLAKGIIKKLLNKVSDAKEACEKAIDSGGK